MSVLIQHQPDVAYGPLFEILAGLSESRRKQEEERRERQRQAALAAQQQLPALLSQLPQLANGFQPTAPPAAAPADRPTAIQSDPATLDPSQLPPAEQLKLILAQQQDKFNRDALASRSRDVRTQAFYNSADRIGQYGQGGRSDQAVASIINNLIDNQQQGSTQRAMFDRQLAAQAATEGRQMQLAEFNAEADLRNRLALKEPPEEIVEGLRLGRLRYTREQERELDDLEDSIAKARGDGKLAPAEKMEFERQQRERIREIRHNPIAVPPNKWPVPNEQRYQQNTIQIQDETTGLPITKERRMRSGEEYWETDAASKSRLKAWEKQQEIKAKQEYELWAKRNGIEVDNREANRVADKRYAAEIALLGHRPRVGESDTAEEDEAADKEWLRQYWEITDRYFPDGSQQSQQDGNIQSPPDPEGVQDAMPIPPAEQQPVPPAVQPPQTPQQPPAQQTPDWEPFTDPSGNQTTAMRVNSAENLRNLIRSFDVTDGDWIIGPTGIPRQVTAADAAAARAGGGRVIVDSDEDARRYGLPDGTPIIDSRGRTGTWHSDSAAVAPVSVSTREELAALPVGTRIVLPDGRTGIRQDSASGTETPPAWYLNLRPGDEYAAPDGSRRIKR